MSMWDEVQMERQRIADADPPPGYGRWRDESGSSEISLELPPPIHYIDNSMDATVVWDLAQIRVNARHLGSDVELDYLEPTEDTLYYSIVGKPRPRKCLRRFYWPVDHQGGRTIRQEVKSGTTSQLVTDCDTYLLELTTDLRLRIQPRRYERLVIPTKETIYLVRSFVERQVNGDVMVKDIRRLVPKDQVEHVFKGLKIIRLDGGGWHISRNGLELSVGELLLLIQTATSNP